MFFFTKITIACCENQLGVIVSLLEMMQFTIGFISFFMYIYAPCIWSDYLVHISHQAEGAAWHCIHLYYTFSLQHKSSREGNLFIYNSICLSQEDICCCIYSWQGNYVTIHFRTSMDGISSKQIKALKLLISLHALLKQSEIYNLYKGRLSLL